VNINNNIGQSHKKF